MAMKSMMFSMQFEIHNPSRTARIFTVSAQPGRVEELKALVPHLGRRAPKLGAGKLAKVGFVADTCPDQEAAERAPAKETVEVKPGARVGLSVVGKLEGESALLHVVQEADGKQVGGLSVLVLRAANQVKGRK
jgi:hypothetical protein